MIPFGWRVLWYKAKARPRPLQLTGRLLYMGSLQAAWWLDDLLLGRWKESSYKGPIFILGHQRSATTTVHRALHSSPQATGATMAQMLLPAMCFWKLGHAGMQMDKRCGHHVTRWIKQKQDAVLSPLEDMHHIRLGLVEEDEFFFWTILASGMCANDSMASMDNRDLDFLRHTDTWSEQRRQAVWNWYEACLHKTAYFASLSSDTCPSPWVVAKNPAFSQRIPELRANFPQAKFIVLHRDPRRAIASRLRLIQTIWSTLHDGDILAPQHVELIYQDSLREYRGLDRDVPGIPQSNLLEFSAAQLKKDPVAVLRAMESAFGISVSSFPSPHPTRTRVKLENFGLSPSRVEADLPTLFERRAWEIE
jgi:hypothetical protein